MPRTFLVCDGRTVTLPQGLQAGPGATNMRLPAGAVVTLDDARLAQYSRFVAGRERAGDWREIDPKDAPENPTPAIHVQPPDAPSSGVSQLVTGSPITPKEG